MTAAWSGHESASLAELLRQYWADVLIGHLSSYESLDGIVIKGNDSISNSSLLTYAFMPKCSLQCLRAVDLLFTSSPPIDSI